MTGKEQSLEIGPDRRETRVSPYVQRRLLAPDPALLECECGYKAPLPMPDIVVRCPSCGGDPRE